VGPVPGAAHPDRAARLPDDLLLLPQGLLPGLLDVAAGLRRGRAAREVHGRDAIPADREHLHRYFFYLGLVFNVLLTYDAVLAFKGMGDEEGEWGHMGLGT